ncbi:MAG: glycosyltransferase [Polyangiaceae bacterium]
MSSGLDFVIIGLSITSSWGNGHATTYRGLVRELAQRGHRLLFLERDVPWYALNRDMARPPGCETKLYGSFEELTDRFERDVRAADVVIVGSYLPEGARVGAWVLAHTRGNAIFYDIDTPVTLREVESGTCDYLTPELAARYDLYLSFTGGPTLARLQSRFGARRARPLYCAVDPEVHFVEPCEVRWDLGYLGTYSADRQTTLTSLLVEPACEWPEGRFAVVGPQYPEELRWPLNVMRLDHLAPGDHRGFYNAQRFTLNINRLDMARAGWSPSVRLFEAAACATPIITDAWPGLEAFFEPGREVIVARTPGEVIATLQRTAEGDRRTIGHRARVRALAEHTAAHRAETLEGWVRELLDAGAKHPGNGRSGATWEAR